MTGSFSESRDDWLPQLYQERWDAFVRLATLLLADQQVAEDAVIAAFATSYLRDPKLHSYEHAVSYVRTAVVNKARSRQPAERDATPPETPEDLAYWCLRVCWLVSARCSFLSWLRRTSPTMTSLRPLA